MNEMPVTTLWRISNYADLSGEGGRRSSGRWHTAGKAVIYLADCPASAMLERLVHLQDGSGKLPPTYQLLKIDVPEAVAVKDLLVLADARWTENILATQKLGDGWLASLETPLARVPSAIVPSTWNYLLNPACPNCAEIVIKEAISGRFDNRLFAFRPH
jgi:RES domain-containing protein